MPVLYLSGCAIFDPEEPTPATLHLEPFQFQAQPGQGTADNRITEVWVYANSSQLGAFSPPVDIQYLDEGHVTFRFRPGIRNNGILNDAIIYPLFSAYTVDLEVSPGSEHLVKPATGYLEGARFSLLVDFELNNPFTNNRDTLDGTNLVRSQADVYEGQYAGEIVLTATNNFIEVGHVLDMTDLPVDGKAAYLEFRYKNDTEFSIGLLATSITGESYANFFYLVKPTDTWNMLYIELTDLLKASALPAYKILFKSIYPPSSTQPELRLYFDNIKVVHL